MKLKQIMEKIGWKFHPMDVRTRSDAVRVTEALEENSHAVSASFTINIPAVSGRGKAKKIISFHFVWTETSQVVLCLQHPSKWERGPLLFSRFDFFLKNMHAIVVTHYNCPQREGDRVREGLLAMKIRISNPPPSLSSTVSVTDQALETTLDLV